MGKVLRLLLLIGWFVQAEIPPGLWVEYTAVIACESGFDPSAENGLAKGLMQIQWEFWREWSNTQTDQYYTTDEWASPVQSLRLAHHIQENYSLPRGRSRWSLWEAKPDHPRCIAEAEAWLSLRYGR